MIQRHERHTDTRGEPQPHRRLQWVLAGRLIIATVLLGTTLYLAQDGIRYGHFTPSFLLVLISIIYASSILFGVWLLRGSAERSVAMAVAGLDVVLITGLVYLTGGAGSIFSFLYGAEILTAALTLGAGAAYYTAATCLALYFFQGLALNVGWIAPPPDQPLSQYILDSRDFAFALLWNMVGIGAVALLATNLARRAQVVGARLRVAEQSAERLARLNDDIVRSIASGLITADDTGQILAINRAAQDILRDPTSSLLKAPLSKVLPNYDSIPLSEPPRRAESVGLRADGTEFPMGYTMSSLVDSEGRAFGRLLAFQDLTEIKTLKDRAERATRLAVLGELAAGLAHEIRNPLSSISGSVEMVREGTALGAEDRHLLGIVIAEVDRLNGLVTTMLDVGRPRDIRPESTDLRDLVEDVVAVARGSVAPDGARPIVLHLPDGPVLAIVDPDRMRQVLWNLVKNAVQASPARGTVEVYADRDEEGRPYVEVADQGPGIGDAQRERLFDMFYTGRSQGVGLGLALVKQIVDQHRGQVDIFDRPGGGTRFRITVPAPPNSESSMRSSARAERQGPPLA